MCIFLVKYIVKELSLSISVEVTMGERRVLLDEKESRKTRREQGRTDSPKNDKSGKHGKKKKKSCCCSCLITFAVTLAVILIAGAGAGWYLGDRFTRANFDMSLSECFSVIGGLYSPKESKIVTNGYTESDLEAFYGDLKKAVFLNENADISVDTIYELIGGESSSSAKQTASDTDEPPVSDDGESGDGESDAIMKYIAALFTPENVDLTALKNYDESRHEQYLLNIKDRGLAAFADALLGKILADNADISSMLGQYGIDDISKYVSLKQIIFGKKLADVNVTDENGEIGKEMKEVSTLAFTVKIDLAGAVKPVLEKYGAGAAHFAVKLIIPNDVYITLETGLDAAIETGIRINRIDNEEKADKAFALADGIMNFAGGAGESIKSKLDALVAEKVRPFVEQYIGYADLGSTGEGVLKVDPFETIASIALPPEEGQQPLTGSDILGTLSGMLTTDYENAIDSDSTHNDQYKAEEGEEGYNPEYKTVYAPARLDKDNLVDYKQAFLNELSEKYLIDLDGEDGISGTDDDIEFSDFMALFGIGTSNKKVELMKLIDGERMKDLLGKDAADIVVNVNDRMMGAIISETLTSVLGDFDAAAYGLQVQQVILREKDGRQFIELGVSASMNGLLSSLEGNPLGSVVSAFVPDKIMLSVNVDVTRGSLENEYVKTEIRYNDSTAEKTQRMLEVIGRVAGALDVDEIAAKIAAPLREMLARMYEMLGGLRLTQSKMILPDVFEIMSDLLFKTDGGDKVVSGGEIRNVLSSLTTSDEQDYLQNTLGIDEAAQNYDSFMAEIKDKYYITANTPVNTFDDIFSVVDFANFDGANFDLQRLKSDGRDASELRPKITDAELAHVFAEKMNGESFGSSAGIKGIKIGRDGDGYFVKLAIELKLTDALGGDMASVIPVRKIYVVALCRLDTPLTDSEGNSYYATDITVNEMNGAQLETLNKMIAHLGGGSLDIAAMEKDLGRIIYDSFETMKSSLGGDGFEFTDGGILITDFYSFLAKATGLDTQNPDFGSNEAEVIANVKAAVQGLYKGDGANNFDESDIVGNAAVPVDFSTSEGIEASFENYSVGADGFEGQMADNRFAGYLYERFADKNAVLKELTIINRGNAKAAGYYEELAAMGVSANSAHDYIRLVVSVDFARLTSAGESNLISAFMPAEMYVTVYIDMSDKTNAMRINNLSSAAQKVLFAMTKLDAESMNSVLEDSLDVLGEYESATFVDSETAGAVGSIKTKFDVTAA